MKTIIVACGGGVATSQTVAVKLQNMLEDNGYGGQVQIEAININSIDTFLNSADVYVSISPYGEASFDIPTFSGVPFLTGVGVSEEFDKIVHALKLT